VRRIVDALRRVIRRAAPGSEESIVWGAWSYHRPWIGGRVKGATCQIVVKRGRVRLDFIHGIRLHDPQRLLQGTGISKRYVPIPSVAVARRRGIEQLIREAAAFIPDAPDLRQIRRRSQTSRRAPPDKSVGPVRTRG
jgi:hypothetical protein